MLFIVLLLVAIGDVVSISGGGMEGADIGVGWVDTEGKDRHAFDFAKPVIDNTTDNWLALRGRESNG
ncbi:unnamed protein product [Rotaria magnacalcarata]|uniref:Uncharacterized protein n=1 Tax=Rotaria magnacalcarata TaxID=392030 RepID=A0A8S3BAT1_9BILA|nr:unnamed protein product [Rotaria magnacalcarata]CAF4801368.1 unnamed protein product [Rotaria magnacalcarata]CAF4815610.1 unnamed protein product [Rotaria magnacalcarata]